MEQAKQYLIRYQQAETLAEKQIIAVEYQTFLETLTETERNQARSVTSVLWLSIRQRVDELESIMYKLEAMLERLEKSTRVEANVKP